MVHFVNSDVDYVYLNGARGFEVKPAVIALIRGVGLTRYVTAFRLDLRGTAAGGHGGRGPKPGDRTVRIVIPDADMATVDWSSITGGTSLSGSFTVLGASYSSLSSGSVVVINSMGREESGFDVTLSRTEGSAGSTVFVTASTEREIDQLLGFRLLRNSFRAGDSQTFNSPMSDRDSALVTVNNKEKEE